MAVACSGLVPQVMVGGTSGAWISITSSQCAPSSEVSVFQKARAVSHWPPLGADGRPFI